MTTVNSRSTDYPIDPLFLQRWSPRAFTSAPMSEYELLTILEAGRWAPSSYNSQPWRFIYARRDTEHWPKLLRLLTESNQSWARTASALVIVISKRTLLPRGADREVPSHSHSFDTGAAWASLALQAARSGWAAHGMVGFDIPRAATELGVPDGYRVEAAIAIGKQGDKSILPESLRAREAPSDRRPLSQLAGEGSFGAIKS
jgi:nitroreductase